VGGLEEHQVDRLPVVDPDDPRRLLGIVTKDDIASTFHKLLSASG
jgi:CBS domain-containing protein